MATLESRLIALAQAIGTDVKTLLTNQGVLENLTTTQKASLVEAINEIKSDLAGAGAGVYTNASATPSAIGGISAGSTFAARTWQQMFDALLYPYQSPSFNAFSMSGQSTTVEVGATTPANPTLTWSTANSGNISANTIQITNVTGGNVVLLSGSANDGTQAVTLAPITKTTASSHTLRIQATNSLGGTFTRDYTVTWQWRVFYGESASASLDEAGVEALRVGSLASGYSGTKSFSAGGYKYFAYPTAMGVATSFKDSSTNLDVPFQPPQTVSVTNANGVTTNYYVYRSTNVLGSAINIVIA